MGVEVVEAFSPEWAARFCDEVNRSSSYRDAAASWEGTVGLVVLAEPDKRVPQDLGVFMDLWHGAARDIRMCTRPEAEAAQYVITGSYTTWKRVALKDLNAIKGIMLGRLKLRGDFPTLVRYTRASQELTECLTLFAARWPDDA